MRPSRLTFSASQLARRLRKISSPLRQPRFTHGPSEEVVAVGVIMQSGLFDPHWYASQVAGLDVQSAARHYLSYGVTEGRQPSPHFDAIGYLASNPDVAAAGINPLLHWIRYGCSERRSSPLIGPVPEPTQHLLTLCNPYQLEQAVRHSDPKFQISVVTPTYNTDPELLQQLYTTLHNQLYGNWEWRICDDASFDPRTIDKLLEIASTDPRVRVEFSERNGGISEASNRAVTASTGEYIALVDHDDLLSRDVFLEIYRRWKIKPSDVYYTDECKISSDGVLYDFFHKPTWSPVFLENTMYIGHLTVYRRQLVLELGGFRSRFDGTQDYDLALRVSRCARHVEHVPIVGYLWRAIPGSTATSLSEKSYALDRQKAAVLDHARALDPGATVQPGVELGLWRAIFPLPKHIPLLSYVMPTGAGRRMVRGESVDLISNCINSLLEKKFYPNCEYIIVHNGDLTKEHYALLERIDNVKLVYYDEPELNLARKMNLGVTAATGEYVCLLNDDIEVIDESGGEQIVGFMSVHESVGSVAPLCLFENGKVQHNGVVLLEQGPSHYGVMREFGFRGHFGNLHCRREAFAVTGAMLFCRKSDYVAVGGFDESFPLNYNDVDFCQKLLMVGKSSVVDPGVRVFHFESATKTGTFRCEKEALFRKWPDLADSFFNKAFNQRSPYFERSNAPQVTGQDAIAFEEWLDRRIASRADLYPSSGQLKLSVCVPIFNQTRAQLQELYVSYRMQTYQNRELVLVDDASTNEETIAWLDRLPVAPDVRVVRLAHNRGIAGASKAMLAACRGDYYLPVDADDFLTVDALGVMAHYIERYPDADVFYSDEFKSNPASEKFAPYIKPEFDPVMISNCCYVTHLMAFRASTMRRLKAYTDDRATWCHDWDSTFRCLNQGIDPIHVPELLYAWRINPGSTASMETGEKPAAIDSQRFVLERTIRQRGLSRDLVAQPNRIRANTGMWRLEARRPLPAEHIDAEWFWSLDPAGRREVLERLVESSEHDWFLFTLRSTEFEEVASAFAALAFWDRRVAGVSSLLTDSSREVVEWGGAARDGDSLVDRHYGVTLSSGGYSGQLFCQRCIDVMAPFNMALRRDLLEGMLEDGRGEYEAPQFMLAVTDLAQRMGLLLTITPHILDSVPRQLRNLLPSAKHITKKVEARLEGPRSLDFGVCRASLSA